MTEKEQKLNKRGLPALALGIIIIILTTIWAFNRTDYNAEIYNMISKEYTFESYQLTSRGAGLHGSWYHKIYVSEESQPLVIDSISLDEVNLGVVEALKSGDKISCRVIETTQVDESQNKFAYEITELSHNGKYALSIDGYIKTHGDNQITGCVFFGIFGAIFLFMGIVVLFNLDKRVKCLRKLFKPIKRK